MLSAHCTRIWKFEGAKNGNLRGAKNGNLRGQKMEIRGEKWKFEGAKMGGNNGNLRNLRGKKYEGAKWL